jgi:DNA mismatch repair protein MutS2
MISITEKNITSLQFPTVLETISSICNTEIGKGKALNITPFRDKESLRDKH